MTFSVKRQDSACAKRAQAGAVRAISMNSRCLRASNLDPMPPPCVCCERLNMAQSTAVHAARESPHERRHGRNSRPKLPQSRSLFAAPPSLAREPWAPASPLISPMRESRSFFSIFLQKIKSQRVLSTRSQNPSLPPSLNPPAQRSSLPVPSTKICPSSQAATGSSKLSPKISKSKPRCSPASSLISLRTRSSPPTPPACPYRKSPQHCPSKSGKDFSVRISSIPRATCAFSK